MAEMKEEPMELSKNYECFVKADLRRYEGKWVAFVEGKVAASGEKAEEVYRQAQAKYPDKRISLAKVPKAETLVLG